MASKSRFGVESWTCHDCNATEHIRVCYWSYNDRFEIGDNAFKWCTKCKWIRSWTIISFIESQYESTNWIWRTGSTGAISESDGD